MSVALADDGDQLCSGGREGRSAVWAHVAVHLSIGHWGVRGWRWTSVGERRQRPQGQAVDPVSGRRVSTLRGQDGGVRLWR
jgi:hypothetical protein